MCLASHSFRIVKGNTMVTKVTTPRYAKTKRASPSKEARLTQYQSLQLRHPLRRMLIRRPIFPLQQRIGLRIAHNLLLRRVVCQRPAIQLR